ncbi:MAG: hypothetical protein K6G73_12250 [Marinilabiliaceae bacterium]|nr:hypothetical protein [Marinilabiliaceae bacterium]
MGEYAKRKKDGAEVKIGTCNQMYYCTLKDRHSVEYDFDYEQTYYWRLPMMGDYTQAGEGEAFDWRSSSATCINSDRLWQLLKEQDGAKAESNMRKYSKSTQVVLPTGVIFSIKCLHGFLLPNIKSEDIEYGAQFNGKRSDIRISYIRTKGDSVDVAVECVHCGTSWLLSVEELEKVAKYTYNVKKDPNKPMWASNIEIREEYYCKELIQAIKAEIKDYIKERKSRK